MFMCQGLAFFGNDTIHGYRKMNGRRSNEAIHSELLLRPAQCVMNHHSVSRSVS